MARVDNVVRLYVDTEEFEEAIERLPDDLIERLADKVAERLAQRRVS